jgi:hypothetical protein
MEVVMTQVTEKTLAWARQHDWGRNAKLINGVIFGLDEHSVDTNGQSHHKEARFTTVEELRMWAGY